MVSSLTRAAAFFSVGVRVAAALVATAAEPATQFVAEHEDGDFSLRIGLDAPMRFALLYPVSIVTGTCITEMTESALK